MGINAMQSHKTNKLTTTLTIRNVEARHDPNPSFQVHLTAMENAKQRNESMDACLPLPKGN
jgi:hypothetical protein